PDPGQTPAERFRSMSARSPRVIFATIILVFISEGAVLGYSLVSYALPYITQDLHTTQGGWLITAYTLSGAVIAPLVGKLGDTYGKRRIMLYCLSIGLVGAILATWSPSMAVLIVGRILQGVVGPTMFMAYSLVRDVFPKAAVPIVTAITMTGTGVFAVGFPALLGWLLDGYGFRALFALDIVWIAALIPILRYAIPETDIRNRMRVDGFGALLITLGVGGVLAGISLGSGQWGWLDGRTVAAIAGGIVLLVVFGVYSRRVAEPVIDVRVFKTRPVLVALTTGCMATAVVSGYSIMSSLIGQTPIELGGDYGVGLTASAYAWVIVPQTLTTVVFGMVAGALAKKTGALVVMQIGLVFLIGSCLMVGFVVGTSHPLLLASGLLFGVGNGMSYGAIPTLALAGATRETRATTVSMVQTGTSIFGSIVPILMYVILNANANITDEAIAYSAHAFRLNAVFMVALLAIALVASLTVLRRTREQTLPLVEVDDPDPARA
ncbi:MAG: MFS transporter, partial [Bifidobacteriaceae bacterium]|nr:MFS transporter [Bifidobacteriaceae bacterium]